MLATIPLAAHAAEQVCKDYQPLVEATVRQLNVPGDALRDDAVQEGTIGLLAAHRNYDATSPVKFGVYARTYVRGAIIRGVYTTPQTTEMPSDEPLKLDPLAQDIGDAEADIALRLDLADWVGGLGASDGWIIHRLYWDDIDVAVVAAELGVTPRRINQRHTELLAIAAVEVAA